MAEGAAAPLASTIPPVSFPAWSTFATGLSPGEHGLFDFTQKVPGAYRIRFTNATDRRGETIFARASRAGVRVLCLGMPATFPPEPVNGLLVSGFDAPVSTGTDARSASDPGLYRALAARSGPWMTPDLDEGAHGPGWHDAAPALLRRRVARKTAFALEALHTLGMGAAAGAAAPELACVVFAESDTVQHHFWRDFDPESPRHDPSASRERRDAIASLYAALDSACGALREAMGEDSLVVVVSDHGAGGASDRVVHVNAHLAECGLLVRAPAPGGLALDAATRAARDLALRALPAALVQRAFRRLRGAAARVESAARFGGFDWARSRAFSEEANTQPGVWLNLRGREAAGSVAPAEAGRVRRDVIDALVDWKLPDGSPVVAWARAREEVYAGPCVERAPDVVFELALDAGYGLSLVATPWGAKRLASVRRLAPEEHGGGRGRGLNGTHRREGLCIASGAEWQGLGLVGGTRTPSLAEVGPALLGALGVEATPDAAAPPASRHDYDAGDEVLVAARLRALGYLD
jgi:predicted AlkP superfamily phosphohydrolase/phosphomutase